MPFLTKLKHLVDKTHDFGQISKIIPELCREVVKVLSECCDIELLELQRQNKDTLELQVFQSNADPLF